jgi:hypothetical protein
MVSEKNAIEETEESWDEIGKGSTDPLLCIRPMVTGFGCYSAAATKMYIAKCCIWIQTLVYKIVNPRNKLFFYFFSYYTPLKSNYTPKWPK